MFVVEFLIFAVINGGRYILKILGICDIFVRENVMDSSIYVIDVKDIFVFIVIAVIVKYDFFLDVDKIDVFFLELMDVEKLKNLSSYFVGVLSVIILFLSIKGVKVDYILLNGDRIIFLILGVDDILSGKWS